MGNTAVAFSIQKQERNDEEDRGRDKKRRGESEGGEDAFIIYPKVA